MIELERQIWESCYRACHQPEVSEAAWPLIVNLTFVTPGKPLSSEEAARRWWPVLH